MPTYEYACGACGHKFEEFQSITAKSLRKCPECSKLKLKRLIGTGAGIIFKGSGFYETDYRSEGYDKAKKAEADASSKPAKKDTASDSKKDSSSNTKTSESASAKKTETAPKKGNDPSKSSKA